MATELKTPQEISLGPRKLEDLLSEAFRIYKSNYTKLWAIATITGVLNAFFFVAIYGGIFLFPLLSESDRMMSVLPYMIIGGVLGYIGFIIVSVLVQCALIYFVAVQYYDEDIGFSDSYGYAWSRLGTALGTSILVGLTLGALVLTIIGIPFAIYLGVCWCFALPCVMIRGTGIIEAFSKSYALVKGNWWRVFGINLMFAIIVAGINSIAGIIPVLGLAISTIVGMPVAVLGSVLLYFDLRVRKQDYTSEELAEELNTINTS